MASSLRDIPGANRSRKRARARRSRQVWAPPAPPSKVSLGPRPLRVSGRANRGFRPKRSIDWGLIAVWILGLGVAGWLAMEGWKATRVEVAQAGISDGMIVTAKEAEELEVEVSLESESQMHQATVTFNGTPIVDSGEPVPPEDEEEGPAAPVIEGTTVRWRPGPLPEGEHALAVSIPRPVLPDSTFEWSYTVDATAPKIELPRVMEPVAMDAQVEVAGKVEEQASLTWSHAGSEMRSIDHDGDFALDFDLPPAGPILFEATDVAGNVTRLPVMVPVAYPDDLRAVHVTAVAWGYEPLRNHVMELIESGRVNAVELDLKDEAGVVGYDSEVPRAVEIGAVQPEYDLEEALEYFHSRGVHVIGRIVAFRDPILADFAWQHGQNDQVVQTPTGERFAGYGGFTNYAHPDVRQYNIDLATEAAERGVDDILYDYVRRPDGDPATMMVPGLQGKSADAVNAFLAQSHTELRKRGTYQGASVFGIAADRPDSIAQHIPTLGRHVDYVAPMLYPSHWVDGEYRVDSPIRQPYEITTKSLAPLPGGGEEHGSGFRALAAGLQPLRRALRPGRGAGTDRRRQQARRQPLPAVEPAGQLHHRGPRPQVHARRLASRRG